MKNWRVYSTNITFLWLSPEAQFVFSVYDWDGSNSIDAFDVGNALRALNLNPTLDLIGKMGGTQKRGEKRVKFDEFLPIYAQVKKEKDMGCYEDFLECLKLYDKEENGTMLLAELQHSLIALGTHRWTKMVKNHF